jgi:hypothetical protein
MGEFLGAVDHGKTHVAVGFNRSSDFANRQSNAIVADGGEEQPIAMAMPKSIGYSGRNLVDCCTAMKNDAPNTGDRELPPPSPALVSNDSEIGRPKSVSRENPLAPFTQEPNSEAQQRCGSRGQPCR